MIKIIKEHPTRMEREFKIVKRFTKTNYMDTLGLYVLVLLIFIYVFLPEITGSWLGFFIVLVLYFVTIGIYYDFLNFKNNFHLRWRRNKDNV